MKGLFDIILRFFSIFSKKKPQVTPVQEKEEKIILVSDEEEEIVEEPVQVEDPVIIEEEVESLLTKVQYFQKKNSLHIDGKVGINTALKIKEVFSIGSIEQLSNFLGQLKHESNNFSAAREAGRYSAKRMAEVWPGFFAVNPKATVKDRLPNNLAKSMEYKPVELFNFVYDDKNRSTGHKLGNIYEGDGWKFRGNGAIQTTGRYNHQLLENYLGGVGLMDDTDILWKRYYIESGIFYFDSRKLWEVSKKISKAVTQSLTKSIQGGSLEVDKRHKEVEYFYNMLKKYK